MKIGGSEPVLISIGDALLTARARADDLTKLGASESRFRSPQSFRAAGAGARAFDQAAEGFRLLGDHEGEHVASDAARAIRQLRTVERLAMTTGTTLVPRDVLKHGIEYRRDVGNKEQTFGTIRISTLAGDEIKLRLKGSRADTAAFANASITKLVDRHTGLDAAMRSASVETARSVVSDHRDGELAARMLATIGDEHPIALRQPAITVKVDELAQEAASVPDSAATAFGSRLHDAKIPPIGTLLAQTTDEALESLGPNLSMLQRDVPTRSDEMERMLRQLHQQRDVTTNEAADRYVGAQTSVEAAARELRTELALLDEPLESFALGGAPAPDVLPTLRIAERLDSALADMRGAARDIEWFKQPRGEVKN